MTKKFTRSLTQMILVAGGALVFSHSAKALDFSDYNCSQKIGGKTIQVVAAVTSGSSYDVKLSVDGKDLPVSGGHCFESNRPSTNYVLCSFKGQGFELDLYPWTQTTSGAIKVMQYVLWNGDQPATSGKFTSCKGN